MLTNHHRTVPRRQRIDRCRSPVQESRGCRAQSYKPRLLLHCKHAKHPPQNNSRSGGGVGLAAITIRAPKALAQPQARSAHRGAGATPARLPHRGPRCQARRNDARRYSARRLRRHQYTWAQYDAESLRRPLTDKLEKQGIAVHAFNEPRWFFVALGALGRAGPCPASTRPIPTSKPPIIRTAMRPRAWCWSPRSNYQTYKSVFNDFPGLKVVLLDVTQTLGASS